MFRALIWAVLIATAAQFGAGTASAAAQSTQETVYRLPKTGVPALTVPAPADWRVLYDDLGNLQLYAPDKSAFLQLSTSPLPAEMPVADMAAEIFKAAGAPPYQRTEADSIGGQPGQAFISAVPQQAFTIDLRVVIVKVGAGNVAVLCKAIRNDASAAQAAALDKLAARVRIAH